MHQIIGSRTWSTNKENISDSGLATEKMRLNEKPNLSEVLTIPQPLRDLLNPSYFSNSNTATTTASTSTVSSLSTPAPLFTFPPLIFTFPTFATVAPMVSSSPESLKLEVLSPINLLTKEMQILMSNFDNKLLQPNLITLPLPLIMLPEQLKFMSPAGSTRNKRSNDYYDNIEEDNDEIKSTSKSIDHIITDNNQQMTKLQKQMKGRKGLLDCMKFLKDS